MNLEMYLSVADAAKAAGVTEQYIRHLLANKKIGGTKLGKAWLVLKADVKAFKRQPGMGRPSRKRKRRPKK